MKLKEDFIGHLGGILVPFFGPVFWVHFSPLFGLRASRERRVSKGFLSVDGGFWPLFRPVFDRPFAQDGVAVFEALFFVGVDEVSRVS
jgi:hypothetical protein